MLDMLTETPAAPKGMANYTPIGPELEGVPENFSIANMMPSFGEFFPAQAGNALRDSGTSSTFRAVELAGANASQNGTFDEFGVYQPGPATAARRVSAEWAKAKAEEAGVKVDFGTADYTEDAVAIMVERARRRAVRDQVISAYDPSLLTSLGVSLAATLVDPLNVASAFIPFVGEARYAQLLAGATGVAGRTGVRAGVGAVEGLGGAALLEPLIAFAATQEGRDYTMADSLANLAFGTVFGSGLHTTLGGFKEVLARTAANAPIISPIDMVDRLSAEQKQTGLRATIADMIDGREVSTADVMDAMAARDPELAARTSYEHTLRRDGPAIDDTNARISFWEAKLSGRKDTPAARAESFMSWVRGKGGVRDDGTLAAAGIGRGDLPASVYLTAKGAARTERGIAVDALYDLAVAEGFVTTRQEFIDAFRASRRDSPLAPITRAADRETAATRAEEAKHVADTLADAGVSPNASNSFKARALVAREQAIVAAERQRIDGATGRLEARRESMRPASPVQAAQEPRETASELMELLDREEAAPPTAKPAKKPQEDAGTVSPSTVGIKSLPPALTKLLTEVEAKRAAVESYLDPESRRALDRELAALDAEEADLGKLYDSALACLIGD